MGKQGAETSALVAARAVPWRSWAEWVLVAARLCGADEGDRAWARRRVRVWASRAMCPAAVEASVALLGGGVSHNERLLAVVRLVNGVADRKQGGAARSVAALASAEGLPRTLVDIRHAATHGALPSPACAEEAAADAAGWLKHRYWCAVAAHVDPLGAHAEHENRTWLLDAMSPCRCRSAGPRALACASCTALGRCSARTASGRPDVAWGLAVVAAVAALARAARPAAARLAALAAPGPKRQRRERDAGDMLPGVSRAGAPTSSSLLNDVREAARRWQPDKPKPPPTAAHRLARAAAAAVLEQSPRPAGKGRAASAASASSSSSSSAGRARGRASAAASDGGAPSGAAREDEGGEDDDGDDEGAAAAEDGRPAVPARATASWVLRLAARADAAAAAGGGKRGAKGPTVGRVDAAAGAAALTAACHHVRGRAWVARDWVVPLLLDGAERHRGVAAAAAAAVAGAAPRPLLSALSRMSRLPTMSLRAALAVEEGGDACRMGPLCEPAADWRVWGPLLAGVAAGSPSFVGCLALAAAERVAAGGSSASAGAAALMAGSSRCLEAVTSCGMAAAVGAASRSKRVREEALSWTEPAAAASSLAPAVGIRHGEAATALGRALVVLTEAEESGVEGAARLAARLRGLVEADRVAAMDDEDDEEDEDDEDEDEEDDEEAGESAAARAEEAPAASAGDGAGPAKAAALPSLEDLERMLA